MNTRRQEMDELLQGIGYLHGNKIISLPTANGCEFLTLNDIIRCEGDNNYTVFHVQNAKKLIVSKTLGEYERMFSKYNFYRIHQSHLINLRHVKRYAKDGGVVVLSDGSLVEISRRKKLAFFKLFSL